MNKVRTENGTATRAERKDSGSRKKGNSVKEDAERDAGKKRGEGKKKTEEESNKGIKYSTGRGTVQHLAPRAG
jgi:F0F1-type ATP synthase membrane subunit b/b'